MKAMAFERIRVLNGYGLPDGGSYIAAGDLCEIREKTAAGLYPVTYPTRKGSKTRWLRTLDGFLCNQNDYPNISYPAAGYEKATIKSGGCGVCAGVNAVGALTGKQVSVWEMRDLAVSGLARVPGGTNMAQLCLLLKREYGLTSRTTSSVLELQAHLRQGGAAICNAAGKGLLSTGGHYVTALGELGGRICIADPGLYAGKYAANARRKAAVTVSGDLIFVKAGDLDGDCSGRWPKYYLLRKGG